MSLISPLDKLKIPVIGSPLFIISNPDLVIAQCKAGIIGSFPCLNAREGEGEQDFSGQSCGNAVPRPGMLRRRLEHSGVG